MRPIAVETIKLLAVFSTVALVAIASSIVVYPLGGLSSAMTAIWLVLIGFGLSIYINGQIMRRANGDNGETLRQIEQFKDSVWEIKDNETRYRDLLDAQSEAICRRDGDGNITFVNKAYCRTFGIEADACLGTSFEPQKVVTTDAANQVDADALGLDKDVGQPVELITAAGPRWFAWERHRVAGPGGRGNEIQEIGRDLTEQRARAVEIAEARDNAQAADRAKSRFLAAMSHEIRTPMNGILGMTGLLMETQQTAEQVNYCQAIDQSARTLLGLIDEILDFSKIEAGRLELQSEPFALHACIQSAVELLAPRAHEKGLEIAWTVDPALPQLVIGDEARVRQILLNLIGNALRFTDRGGVLVNCAPTSVSGDLVKVQIQVRDTGIGIEAGSLEGIFGEFDQGSTPVRKRQGGTGLGLTISRRLAIAMGGDIIAVSAPGRGSTFTVEVGLGVVEGALALSARNGTEATAAHVLLAFSRVIERRALAHNLRSFGITVTETDCASNHGPVLAACDRDHPIDLIIVDADEDPRTAGVCLEQAKAHANGRPVRGIILINALARASLGPFRSQGFGAYLVRPVRPQTLLKQLTVGSDSIVDETTPPDEKTQTAPFANLHVLLAEDNEINALLATRLLEKLGCTMVLARDGKQAIDAVHRSLDGLEREFDLILMDLHMPHLDGIEATDAIRKLVADYGVSNSQLPAIVAVTANAFEEDRRLCLDAGLDDYLAKPFDRIELERMIAKWCSRKVRPEEDTGCLTA